MSRHSGDETFAEVVTRLKIESQGRRPFNTWEAPAPISDGTWLDDHGIEWRRRGDRAPTVTRIEKLLADPEVPLLHIYGVVRLVAMSERKDLWAHVRPYYTDQVQRAEKRFHRLRHSRVCKR